MVSGALLQGAFPAETTPAPSCASCVFCTAEPPGKPRLLWDLFEPGRRLPAGQLRLDATHVQGLKKALSTGGP